MNDVNIIKEARTWTIPRNEENPAFWDVLLGHEVKVVNSIATLISRKTGSEVLIALGRLTNLLHHNLFLLLLYLINYKAISSFCLQLQKP